MDRSRRNVQSRTAKLAGVLESLKAAREGTGAKRASTYEVKQEDAVFDVVDEEQYEQIAAKRRLETGTFIRRLFAADRSAAALRAALFALRAEKRVGLQHLLCIHALDAAAPSTHPPRTKPIQPPPTHRQKTRDSRVCGGRRRPVNGRGGQHVWRRGRGGGRRGGGRERQPQAQGRQGERCARGCFGLVLGGGLHAAGIGCMGHAGAEQTRHAWSSHAKQTLTDAHSMCTCMHARLSCAPMQTATPTRRRRRRRTPKRATACRPCLQRQRVRGAPCARAWRGALHCPRSCSMGLDRRRKHWEAVAAAAAAAAAVVAID